MNFPVEGIFPTLLVALATHLWRTWCFWTLGIESTPQDTGTQKTRLLALGLKSCALACRREKVRAPVRSGTEWSEPEISHMRHRKNC